MALGDVKRRDGIQLQLTWPPFPISSHLNQTRGSVEKGELKPGGARAVPEDALLGTGWSPRGRTVTVGGSGSSGWVRCRSGRRISDGRVWMKTMMSSIFVGMVRDDAVPAPAGGGGIS
eukprot:scaffold568_cov93-Skeletonema_marinoi.AAC.4